MNGMQVSDPQKIFLEINNTKQTFEFVSNERFNIMGDGDMQLLKVVAQPQQPVEIQIDNPSQELVKQNNSKAAQWAAGPPTSTEYGPRGPFLPVLIFGWLPGEVIPGKQDVKQGSVQFGDDRDLFQWQHLVLQGTLTSSKPERVEAQGWEMNCWHWGRSFSAVAASGLALPGRTYDNYEDESVLEAIQISHDGTYEAHFDQKYVQTIDCHDYLSYNNTLLKLARENSFCFLDLFQDQNCCTKLVVHMFWYSKWLTLIGLMIPAQIVPVGEWDEAAGQWVRGEQQWKGWYSLEIAWGGFFWNQILLTFLPRATFGWHWALLAVLGLGLMSLSILANIFYRNGVMWMLFSIFDSSFAFLEYIFAGCTYQYVQCKGDMTVAENEIHVHKTYKMWKTEKINHAEQLHLSGIQNLQDQNPINFFQEAVKFRDNNGPFTAFVVAFRTFQLLVFPCVIWQAVSYSRQDSMPYFQMFFLTMFGTLFFSTALHHFVRDLHLTFAQLTLGVVLTTFFLPNLFWNHWVFAAFQGFTSLFLFINQAGATFMERLVKDQLNLQIKDKDNNLNTYI